MRPIVCTALALGLALGHALGGPAAAADAPRALTVTGSAEVEAAPDLATVTAGVETQEPSATGALDANSEAMAAVFAALDAAGIARGDLQTSQLSLSPVLEPYREDAEAPQKIVAYQAANMVSVRVRQIDGLGSVIDALAKAGANRLYGIGFEVSDPRTALDTARRQAVADARAKAELFAEAAGVGLGPIVTLREGGGAPGPAPFRAKADMAESAPVAEGTVTLSADVEVVFSLE